MPADVRGLRASGQPLFLARSNAMTTDPTPSPTPELHKIAGEVVHLSQGGADVVNGQEVHIEQGGANVVHATTVHVAQGGVFQAECETLHIEQGGAALVTADTVSIHEGGALAALAERIEFSHSRAGIVLANEVHGTVETLLDARGAALAGLVAGVAVGLLLLLGRAVGRRR